MNSLNANSSTQDTNAALDLIPRTHVDSPLYGRSRETHSLSMAYRRAATGGAELVVLTGPAGIGKTTLVQQMRAPLGQQHGYFVGGKFDQLQRDVPFSAIVWALQDLVRQLLTESQGQTRAWRDAVVGAVGRNGRVITEVIPALERIIGPQPPLAVLEPTESQNRFNLVFQNFLQVFCRENRPLVIFLDDMQWADQASLRLLTSLLSAAGTHSLLVIASCRDNEVAATHPFMLAIKELERRAVPVHTIKVGPLGWSDITQYLGDSFRVDGDIAGPLAETIREKTGGNPFFIRQFLQKLQSDGLLSPDSSSGIFKCDLSAIRSLAITENVADLVAQKIGKLDADTQRIVSFGAAIGNRFDLATLASVAECTAERARELLEAAVRAQLLSIPENLGEPAASIQYAFQHDRVQQAAYGMVPASARPALNLNIGRKLLAASGDDVTAHLFEIVNHMNQGIALIEGRAERLRLVKLNLLAATRARNSTAYDLAGRACRSAIELLGWDAWGDNYALAYEAYWRLAECQALMADFEGAFASIDIALAHVRGDADRGRVLTLRTHTFLSMGDMTGAVACGRQAAALFGLDLPESPELVRSLLQAEIGAIIGWCQQNEIESLLDLPAMTDPDRVSLMSLLMHCLPSAYQINPELFALLCCKMVRLSIEHGNCPMSAKGYGSFAAILSGIVGNFRDGYRFGKLGVDLCEKLNDVTVRSACHFTWATFASAWVRPVQESIEVYNEGKRFGLSSGDHPHAAYCASLVIPHLMARGAPVSAIYTQADDAVALLDRIGDKTNIALLRARRRFAKWLMEGTERSLDGEGFDEAETLKELQVTSVSKSMLAHYQSLRVMHRYFDGRFAQAMTISRQLDELMVFVPGMMTVVEHAFFQSLSASALWRQTEPGERASLGEKIDANLRTLETWAKNCPENFSALHLTVAAELASLRDAGAAAAAYERAIQAAAEHDLLHVEAIASELALRHAMVHDAERAASLRERAATAYATWGAKRKALALRG